MNVNDSLVDSHLVSIPGVGSFTAWGFSCRDSQDLRWNSQGSAGLVASSLCSLDDLAACLLQWLNLSTLQSDSNKKKTLENEI